MSILPRDESPQNVLWEDQIVINQNIVIVLAYVFSMQLIFNDFPNPRFFTTFSIKSWLKIQLYI